MRRAIITILLFLALGFVTSVAVAWVAAVGYQATDEDIRKYVLFGQLQRAGQIIEAASVSPPNGGDASWLAVYSVGESFPRWTTFDSTPSKRGLIRRESAYGWPALAMRSAIQKETRTQHPFEWTHQDRLEGRFSIPWPKWDWDKVDHLPLKVIWTGLIIDTLFWMVIWVLAASVRNTWRYNRSLRRIPNGLCGWCGYDLRKTPREGACPECGHDVGSSPPLFRLPSCIAALVLVFIIAVLSAVGAVAFAMLNPAMTWHQAVYHGKTEVVRSAIDEGADPNSLIPIAGQQPTTPLLMSIERGHTELAELFLAMGADPNHIEKGLHPLIAAVQMGNHEVVKRLLNSGALVDSQSGTGESGLDLAVKAGDTELVKVFLQAGADPNLGGRMFTPLHSAQSAEVIKLLIDAGADVNAGSGAWTPLFVIAQQARPELVKELLQHGASISFATIQFTAYPERLENFKLLIQHGADLTQLDHTGLSIWHHADEREDARPIWDLIYEHNSDVNAMHSIDISGTSTPLHSFAARPNPPHALIRFLIEHGADPRIANRDGRTALDDVTDDEIRQWLLNAAAELDRKNQLPDTDPT